MAGAEERKFVDRESFLVFALSLALFITGTCGMIGSDEYVRTSLAATNVRENADLYFFSTVS